MKSQFLFEIIFMKTEAEDTGNHFYSFSLVPKPFVLNKLSAYAFHFPHNREMTIKISHFHQPQRQFGSCQDRKENAKRKAGTSGYVLQRK